ncbi:MAG: hypothetical protein ACI9QC_000202 [Oceanicoccus sp.]|jgi:hypothetical protein
MKKPSHALRNWFIVHFLADMLFGIPLLLAPEWTMELLGLQGESMIAARLVGAALIGIGGNSLIMNKKSIQHFRAMIDLKIIWSAAAIVALALEIAQGASPILWAVLGVFLAFALLWNFYRFHLNRV